MGRWDIYTQHTHVAWICCTKGHFLRCLGGMECDSMRFHHNTKNSMQFKTSELFISGIFHLIFLDCGWPQVTETANRNHGLGDNCIVFGSFWIVWQSWIVTETIHCCSLCLTAVLCTVKPSDAAVTPRRCFKCCLSPYCNVLLFYYQCVLIMSEQEKWTSDVLLRRIWVGIILCQIRKQKHWIRTIGKLKEYHIHPH